MREIRRSFPVSAVSFPDSIVLVPVLYRDRDYNNIVISWLYQISWNNLVPSLIVPSNLLRVVNSLFQTCSNKVLCIFRWMQVDFRGWQCKTFKPFLDSCSFLLSILVFLWHKLKETPLLLGPSHQLHLKQEEQTQITCCLTAPQALNWFAWGAYYIVNMWKVIFITTKLMKIWGQLFEDRLA